MDYYKCEICKKSFNEFEMDFKKAQKDKNIVCEKCRSEAKLIKNNFILKTEAFK